MFSISAVISALTADGFGENAIISIINDIEWKTVMGGKYVEQKVMNRIAKKYQ